MLFNISYFISIYNDEGGIESEVPVCKSKGGIVKSFAQKYVSPVK